MAIRVNHMKAIIEKTTYKNTLTEDEKKAFDERIKINRKSRKQRQNKKGKRNGK